MLLAKAPPTPITTLNLNSKHKHKPKWSPSSCNWKAPHRDNRKLLGYGNGFRLVVVRAGYTRTPMDTPGAYQLIDDETGEKFIVWGGVDDDHNHSPVPSKDVLAWNPKKSSGYQRKIHLDDHTSDTDTPTSSSSKNANQGSTGTQRVPVITNRDLPTTSAGGSAGNFGRLKAQRVRALVKKTSRMKQDISEDDNKIVVEDAPFGKSVSSHAKPEYIGRKKKDNSSRHEKRVSRTSQSQDARDVMQITGTKEFLDHSDVPLKHGFEPHSEHRITPDKPHKSDNKTTTPETSVPKRSAANLRGWGGGGPVRDFETESVDLVKHRRKLSTGSGSGFFSRKSFRDLGCSEYMIESLKGQLFSRPSNIQAMAFPPVIEGKSCIIADQSGSGKTLAYLAPIIQRLRQEELNALSESSSQSPRVIIMAPTAELASQVLSNCRSMSKFGVPFKSMVVTGGFRQKTQLENLQQGVDVLIATPGRFMFLIKGGFLELTNLRCAVFDEVDILFNDDDFEGALRCLINSSPVTTQYLFVTATLPVDIYNKLVEVFPDCEVIMGPGMHRISPGLEEVLVDCSGEDGVEKTPEAAFLNKKSAFLQLVEKSPVSKTIVFCNKIETCRKVENILRRFDRKGIRVQVLPFHAAVAQESRLANMKEFFRSQSDEVSQFLVCTDRASRGIDFARVDHVVLFDFPRDPSEYVRRVGRTARGAGGKGKAFIFVVGKQVSLARRITERNRKGHPLHDVPAAYEMMR